MKEFNGIKFSPITKIYYCFKDGELYKFPYYERIKPKCWELSSFTDKNGRAKKWVKAKAKFKKEVYDQLPIKFQTKMVHDGFIE